MIAAKRIALQAQLLDSVEQAVIAMDLAGAIIYWNRFAEKLYGWTEAEAIGRAARMILPNGSITARTEAIMTGLRAGGSWSGESLVQRRDGTTFPAWVSDSPIHDEQGTLIGIVGVSSDMSERKATEAALRASEQRFRQIEELGPIGLALVAPDGRWLRVNPALCALVGYTREELLVGAFQDITHPDDLDMDLGYVRRALAGEIPTYQLEKRYIRKDGTHVWVLLSVTLVRSEDGRPQYFISQLQDITQRKAAEDALRVSEARFRAVYEHAPIGIALMDSAGRAMTVNIALQQILGYTEEELRGRDFATFNHPDDVDLDLDVFRELSSGKRDSYTLDKRYIHKDGHIVHGHIAASVVRGNDETPEMYVGMLLDLSERRATEERLHKSEALLRSVVTNAQVFLFALDRHGVFTVAEGKGQAALGLRPDEVVGRSIFKVYDEAPDVLEHAHRALAGDAFTAVDRVHGLMYETSWMPLRNAAGAMDGATGVAIDITDRALELAELERAKRAAEDLARLRQEQAEQMEALARVGDALTSSLDPATVYRVILDQAALVLPFDHAEIALYQDGWVVSVATLGGPDIQPDTPLVRVDSTTTTWRSLARGIPVYLADTEETPGWSDPPPWRGPFRVRSVIIVPLRIEGELIGSFKVNSYTPYFYTERHMQIASVFGERATHAVRNARLYAAEQARAGAAEELSRLRSDFVAAVSHELRTPLSAMLGYAEILQARWATTDDARKLDQVNKIVVAANRQNQLVEDLLMLSRLEYGGFSPRVEVIALEKLVRRAVEEIGRIYPTQQIRLEGPPGLKAAVDGERAQQVLVNLLDNACKYSPEGSMVTVFWTPEGDRAVVRVHDRGPGIPEQGQELLFTRFGRIPGSPIRAGRVGTGLGLYISRALAEAMGGTLDLEATGPTGSTFRLRVPLGSTKSELYESMSAPE